MSLHDVLPILLRARSAGEVLVGIGVTDALKVPAAPAPGRRLGWRGTPVARFAAEFGASPVAVAALTVTIVLALLATFANFITPQNPYDLAQLDIMDGMLPPGRDRKSTRLNSSH